MDLDLSSNELVPYYLKYKNSNIFIPSYLSSIDLTEKYPDIYEFGIKLYCDLKCVKLKYITVNIEPNNYRDIPSFVLCGKIWICDGKLENKPMAQYLMVPLKGGRRFVISRQHNEQYDVKELSDDVSKIISTLVSDEKNHQYIHLGIPAINIYEELSQRDKKYKVGFEVKTDVDINDLCDIAKRYNINKSRYDCESDCKLKFTNFVEDINVPFKYWVVNADNSIMIKGIYYAN